MASRRYFCMGPRAITASDSPQSISAPLDEAVAQGRASTGRLSGDQAVQPGLREEGIVDAVVQRLAGLVYGGADAQVVHVRSCQLRLGLEQRQAPQRQGQRPPVHFVDDDRRASAPARVLVPVDERPGGPGRIVRPDGLPHVGKVGSRADVQPMAPLHPDRLGAEAYVLQTGAEIGAECVRGPAIPRADAVDEQDMDRLVLGGRR